MKAAVYYENGDPSVLKYEDVPDPACHPKGIVIRVEAVSIEGGDTLNRWRGALVTTPHIVGYQAAGEIIEVGAEVDEPSASARKSRPPVRFRLARRTARRAGAQRVDRCRTGFDVKLAAAIPVPFGTADDCLFEFGRLKARRDRAGAGRRQRRRRCRDPARQARRRAVLATASSDERLERLQPLGMDHGINYRTSDVVQISDEPHRQQGRRSGRRSGRRLDAAGLHPVARLSRTRLDGRCGRARADDRGRLISDGRQPLADRAYSLAPRSRPTAPTT